MKYNLDYYVVEGSQINKKKITMDFLKFNDLLINDFYNNLFIFNPNCHRLQSFFNKGERCH